MKVCTSLMAALTAGWPYQSFATLVADAWNCVGTAEFQPNPMFVSNDDAMSVNVAKQAAVEFSGTEVTHPAYSIKAASVTAVLTSGGRVFQAGMSSREV